jgi:hypothetical protein
MLHPVKSFLWKVRECSSSEKQYAQEEPLETLYVQFTSKSQRQYNACYYHVHGQELFGVNLLSNL